MGFEKYRNKLEKKGVKKVTYPILLIFNYKTAYPFCFSEGYPQKLWMIMCCRKFTKTKGGD